MHIEYTNGSPTMDMLDHLPPLPLFVNYRSTTRLTEQDELGIYHIFRLHGRIRHIELALSPSILRKALALMNENFPILEHLSLTGPFSPDSGHRLPLTLPKGFLAPNIRHLTLISIALPKRLRVLTSTVSLVTLTIGNIQTSSYFRPRLLVARLRSLPLLEELAITFSIPIPRPSTERELLGEKGAPITLPSLKILDFHGVGAYLEYLVAQIRVPLLEKLYIRLFNQIALLLPHLFYLINTTKVLKRSSAMVSFHHDQVFVSTTVHDHDFGRISFLLSVMCEPLDWQIDCAAQICDALIPTLSVVEKLSLILSYQEIPTDMRNDAIDSATWHDLLRTFVGVKELHIYRELMEEVSRALQVDEIGLDPEFLPNLQSIYALENLFTSFIDTRQVAGRPVRFRVAWWL